MGNITFINGDNLDKDILDKLNNDFDIVFTSPPYNLGRSSELSKTKYGASRAIKYINYNDNMNENEYCLWLEKIIRTYLTKAKYFFLNIQKFSQNKKAINELLFRLNDIYCDEIIINKNNGIPYGINPRVMTNVIEYVYIFSKNNSRAVGTKEWKGTIKNIIHTKGNQGNKYNKIHKAIMPIEWSDWIIENFVKENGKVIDCFGGIGTTAISCYKLNRKCVSIEINETYHNLAIERLTQEKKQIKLELLESEKN